MSFRHRGEPLDGAEAHELYSMFLAHVCSSEFHPRHPLITGAEKLATMLDENHPRFNEVLSDDDDLAEQPQGEPSEEQAKAAFQVYQACAAAGPITWIDFKYILVPAIDNPSGEGPHYTREEWEAHLAKYR